MRNAFRCKFGKIAFTFTDRFGFEIIQNLVFGFNIDLFALLLLMLEIGLSMGKFR